MQALHFQVNYRMQELFALGTAQKGGGGKATVLCRERVYRKRMNRPVIQAAKAECFLVASCALLQPSSPPVSTSATRNSPTIQSDQPHGAVRGSSILEQ